MIRNPLQYFIKRSLSKLTENYLGVRNEPILNKNVVKKENITN
jgi:hypothetical protein